VLVSRSDQAGHGGGRRGGSAPAAAHARSCPRAKDFDHVVVNDDLERARGGDPRRRRARDRSAVDGDDRRTHRARW
jgi:hypothetical protein